jgi:glycosyltransferase involved in cell wall biosynthesis
MNIMLQNHTFYPILGGIENYLYHVSKTFIEKGHQPVILCEKHDDRLSDFENYDGIKIIRHPYYNIPKRMLFIKPKIVAQKLKHFISRNVGNIDLIISRYPHYCFATAGLDLDIPIFYIPPAVFWKQLNKASSNLSIKARLFNFIWRNTLDEMEKESILRSSRTIVLSNNNVYSLADYYGLKGFNFRVVPPGVDLDRFKKGKDLSLLKELSIDKKKTVLLCVGRLPPEKNLDRLLRELRSLKRDNIKLIIVGDGPERRRLEIMSDALGLKAVVSFVGLRKDVERFYSIADIFICPSKYEPFGQVILEAMASSLPCIAFKRVLPEYEVASEEIIEDGVTGYCINPYDRNEFRQKWLYLIDHPDIRKKMGQAGRKACERKFTWNNHVRKLLELMDHRSDGRIN